MSHVGCPVFIQTTQVGLIKRRKRSAIAEKKCKAYVSSRYANLQAPIIMI